MLSKDSLRFQMVSNNFECSLIILSSSNGLRGFSYSSGSNSPRMEFELSGSNSLERSRMVSNSFE